MTGQIYAVNPDGTGPAQLTRVAQGRTAADPAWSPDGRHIAFDSDVSGAVRLWIMDANGSHARMVAGTGQRRGPAPHLHPRWPTARVQPVHHGGSLRHLLDPGRWDPPACPHQIARSRRYPGCRVADSRQIAFSRFQANGIISQVYVMNADGSGAHAVTPPALEGVGPDWSPTGKLITFTATAAAPAATVYVMHPDGTGSGGSPTPRSRTTASSRRTRPRPTDIAFASDRVPRLLLQRPVHDAFERNPGDARPYRPHRRAEPVLGHGAACDSGLRRASGFPSPASRPRFRGGLARGARRWPAPCGPARSGAGLNVAGASWGHTRRG